MKFDRRRFLTTSAASAAALTLTETSFAKIPQNRPTPPPPAFNPNIMESHVSTAQTLMNAFYGSGASAADISAHITAATTCFNEMGSTGDNTSVNSVLSKASSVINSWGSSFTDEQLQTIWEGANSMCPVFTQAEIDNLLGPITITSQDKQTLLGSGISSIEQDYLSGLAAAQSDASTGKLVAFGRNRSGQARLVESSCVLFALGIAALGISAALTGGLTIVVVETAIGTITVTGGVLFGGAAGVLGAFAPFANC